MTENRLEQNFPERVTGPESSIERSFESLAPNIDQATNDSNFPQTPVSASLGPVPMAVSNDNYHDPKLKAIESILEEDLEELFIRLPDASKRAFKVEGEITAKKINALMSETKVAVQRIVDLIRQWLSFLPGVNRFFIEQEAKIKTDKIIAIK